MGQGRNASVYTARGPAAGEDWQAVADAVNERMASRRIGQQELAEVCGVSVSTLRQLQHGAARRIQNKTLAAVSRGLGWPDDQLATILIRSHPAPTVRLDRTSTREHRENTPSSVDSALLRNIEDRLDEIVQRLARLEDALRTRE